MAVTRFEKENTARPRIMIVTNSERPVTVAVGPWKGNTEASAFAINVKSVDKALLKDSNGAGDSFVGGFLALLCKIISEG
jgi:sugar/nucleoside kinase (ribokinase family)